MIIDLLEPPKQNDIVLNKIKRIRFLLKQLGYEVIEHTCSPLLYQQVRRDHPEAVFNLSCTYGWEKSNLVPAILEMVGVPYTGSGMLGLSLARNYTQLFPLLKTSGVRTPIFFVLKAEEADEVSGLKFPLLVYRDGYKKPELVHHRMELTAVLKIIPRHEKILLVNPMAGKRLGVYLLDGQPFLSQPADVYVRMAQKAYQVMEAKGLARFDFVQGDPPTLVAIEISPDPLERDLLNEAAQAGCDPAHLLKILVDHAGKEINPENAHNEASGLEKEQPSERESC